MSDIDDMFREICATLKLDLKKMRANCKGVSDITPVSLFLLVKNLKLKMEVDAFKDTITVYYQDHGQEPCEYPESPIDELKENQQKINAELSKSESPTPEGTETQERFVETEDDDDDPF